MITAAAGLCWQESVTWMPYISITCVIIYVIGHAIGPSESDPTTGYLHTHWLQQGPPLAEVLFGCDQTYNDTCCKSALSCFETWASSRWPWRVVARLLLLLLWLTAFVLCRSHSLCGDHWDVQAVSQACCLHGGRIRPLALQLHCRPRLPLPRGQLHNF